MRIQDLRLRTKFLGGFICILGLLVLLAVVGHRALHDVVQRTAFSDDVASLSTHILQARQFESAYLFHGDEEAATQVREALARMQQLADHIMTRTTSTALTARIDQVAGQSQQYALAFDNDVALSQEKAQALKEMNAAAGKALQLIGSMNRDQKLGLEKIRNESQQQIAILLDRVASANSIYNAALEVKVARTALLNNKSYSILAQWKGAHKDLTDQVNTLRTQTADTDAKALCNRILTQQQKCMDAFKAYLADEAGEGLGAVLAAVKKFMWIIGNLQFHFSEGLDTLQIDSQEQIGVKLGLTAQINQMAQALLNARLSENRLVIERRYGAADEVKAITGEILAAAGHLLADLGETALTSDLEAIAAAVQGYDRAFDHFIELSQRQQRAEAEMVASAQAVEAECLEIATAQRLVSQAKVKQAQQLIWAVGGLAFIVAIFSAYFMGMSITKPIQHTASMLQDISHGDGDLTQRLELDRKDEIGTMADSFNAFVTNLQTMIAQIARHGRSLDTASSGLTQISGQVSQHSQLMSSRSSQVSATASEVCEDMHSVSDTMSQTTATVQTVVDAIAGISRDVAGIANQSDQARQVATTAVASSSSASERIHTLGEAAREISKVTDTITEISEQTNLLALNATIEAARAGEAGKGFSVVANEIKELAKQTAGATFEIEKQIEGIQTATEESVADITQVSKVIHEVERLIATIATTATTQTEAAHAVAAAAGNASEGIQSVAANVQQATARAAEMASNMADVDTSALHLNQSGEKAELSAAELARLAQELNTLVGQFRYAASDG